MGRYEAERTTLSHRLAGGIDQALAKTPFTRPKLPRLKRHATRPLWGFIFSVGFLLVSIVDPYSGTMASASTMQVYDYEGGSPEQTYGYWAHEDDAVPERALDEQPTHWLPAHSIPTSEDADG